MNSNPLVSVVIPVYNTSEFLEDCLSSVFLQDYPNLEIICVDDGSTDESFSKLNSLARKSPARFTVIKQENGGPGSARNNGLLHSQGEYVCFIDSDDKISNNFVSVLLELAISTNSDICATSSVLLDFETSTKKKFMGLPEKFTGVIFSLEEKCKLVETTGVSCNKLYRKSFLIENNINYLKLNSPSEDNYFTILSVFLANQIGVTDQCTYFYRQHALSITKRKITYEAIDTFLIYLYAFQRIYSLPLRIDTKKICLQTIVNRLQIDSGYVKITIEEGFHAHFENEKDHTLSSMRESIQLLGKNNVEPKIIVSLTSYPKRINTVAVTIKSLLNQSIKPDVLILWLSEEEFPNRIIPESISSLQNEFFEVRWCENLKSYKKLIPALRHYPDDIIITVDDDVDYPPNLIEILYKSYLKDKNTIHCNRCHWIRLKDDNVLDYKDWKQQHEFRDSEASFLNFMTGLGGVLYPPHSLSEKVFDRSIYEKLCPTGDDIWFWSMAVINGTRICRPKGFIKSFSLIEGSQDDCLWKTNQKDNDRQLMAVMKSFPILRERLVREKIRVRPVSSNYKLNKLKKIVKSVFPEGTRMHCLLKTIYSLALSRK